MMIHEIVVSSFLLMIYAEFSGVSLKASFLNFRVRVCIMITEASKMQ